MPTNHTWSQVFDVNYATPLAIVAGLIVISYILQKFFGDIWDMIVL